MTPSRSHLVVIPSFNSGPILRTTVEQARAAWAPVWVVDDGSTDGSADALDVRVLRYPQNRGKGAAVQAGLRAAEREGFSHALVMDADGQHPADRIAAFMQASLARPDAMILGEPLFGAEAPRARVWGRRLSNAMARALTGLPGDSLFGFRVYPIRPLLAVMDTTRWMRGFDFDAEALVRLAWSGVPAIRLPAAVRYLRPAEGGLSHFRYGRDNLLLSWMYLRLVCGRRAP